MILNKLDPDYEDTEKRHKIDSVEKVTGTVNNYISRPDELNEYFVNFSKEVLKRILKHSIVIDQKGDEAVSDLILRYAKLFISFIKDDFNKKPQIFEGLFQIIQLIFDKYYEHPFFISKKINNEQKTSTHKELNYENFNLFFEENFKEAEKEENYKANEIVDIYHGIKLKNNSKESKKDWIKGKISEISDNYLIDFYEVYGTYKISKEKFPKKTLLVTKKNTHTKYFNYCLNLEKNQVIDCYLPSKNIWLPAIIQEVNKKENGLSFAEYKVSFELKDEDKKDAYEQFWIEYFDENENIEDDMMVTYDSYQIHNFHIFTDIQMKYFKIKENKELADNYKDLMNFMQEIFENDKNIEYFYKYEGENKESKNYVLGKYDKNFSFYFAKLLKAMGDNKHFEYMKYKLRNNPNKYEIKTIFCILINGISFIHKKFFQNENNKVDDVFEKAVFSLFDNKSEISGINQKDIYYFVFFLVKIKYLTEFNDEIKNIDPVLKNNTNPITSKIDELFVKLGLKMLNSSSYKVRELGLDIILDCIEYSCNENEDNCILSILKDKGDKKEDFIKVLFGDNYHSNLISKSTKIFILMSKYSKYKLKEDELKIIFKFIEKKNTDEELEKTIINLFSNLLDFFNDKECFQLLNFILNEEKNMTRSIEIKDMFYNLKYLLSKKSNNDDAQLDCCNYFSDKILKVFNSKRDLLDIVIECFNKGKKFQSAIIKKYFINLKEKKNIENIIFSFESFGKILKEYNKSENNKSLSELINDIIKNEEIDKIKIFEDKFKEYKRQCKDLNPEEHEKNLKIIIDFIMDIIPMIEVKSDYFGLLKEICLDESNNESDKTIKETDKIKEINKRLFYEYINKFIDDDKINLDYKKEKEEEIFEIICKSDKNTINLEQIQIFIKVFKDINISENILINDNEMLKINEKTQFQNIRKIDELWETYLNLNSDEESKKKLYEFIYKLYHDNGQINNLLEKGTNIIKKDIDKLNKYMLENCINIINYIIIESEKDKLTKIKSHSDILKNSIMYIPIILYDQNIIERNNILNEKLFEETIEEKEKYLFYGNTNLCELRKLIHEKYDSFALNINIFIIEKGDKDEWIMKLDSSYDKFSLESISKKFNSRKFIFAGKRIEESFFENNNTNPKFEKMLEQWFSYFSKGKSILETEDINDFECFIFNNENKHFMEEIFNVVKDDKVDNKIYMEEKDFIKLFEGLAKEDPGIVFDKMRQMKYRKNFEKIEEVDDNNENNEYEKSLPRYLLGNDKILYDALIQIFEKSEEKQKKTIFEFLNSLCTNESIYNDEKSLLEISENKKYLQYSYELTIILSFIQDFERNNLDIKKIFPNENDCFFSEKYIIPDTEENFTRKKNFLINFFKEGKANEYIKKLLNKINNDINNSDDNNFICIDIFTKISNIVNFEQNILNNKTYYELNNVINSTYYLNGNNKIINEKIFDDEIVEGDERTNNFNEILYLIFSFISNNKEMLNEDCFKSSFNILLNMPDFNIKISEEINQNQNEEENNLNDKEENEIIEKNDNKIEENKEEAKIEDEIDDDENYEEYYNNNDENEDEDEKNDNNEEKKINKEDSSPEKSLEDNNEIPSTNVEGGKSKIFLLIRTIINNNNSNSKYIDLLGKYINNLSNFGIQYNNNDEKKFSPLIYDVSLDIFKKILKDSFEDFDNLEPTILYLKFFCYLIKIIDDFKDEFPIDDIINIINNDLRNKYLETNIFIGLLNILIEFINKKKINDESIKETFEIIKTIILDENLINKVKMKLDDLRKNDAEKKMISFKEVKEFFDYIKNPTDGEKLENRNFFVYKDFILNLCNESDVIDIIKQLFDNIKNDKEIEKEKEKNINEKKIPNYMGLIKCDKFPYLNSIIQQLYNIPTLRDTILSIEINDDTPNILKELQKMFTYMLYSEKVEYDNTKLCKYFDELINNKQNRGNTNYFKMIFEKLKDCLENTDYKYIIDDLFKFVICTSTICDGCKNEENKYDEFYILNLDIRNSTNLTKALQNKFNETSKKLNCASCFELHAQKKKVSISGLPNVLIIQLDRICFDYEYGYPLKVDGRLEFDTSINLESFYKKLFSNGKKNEKIESVEYNYELKGIINYQGNTETGYYTSIIHAGDDKDYFNDKWLYCVDEKISKFEIDSLPFLCYGGEQGMPNAYYLIYSRKKNLNMRLKGEGNKIPKQLFLNIIQENGNFNKNNEAKDYKKCGLKFKLIILDAITSRNIDIINNKPFSYHDIKNLIGFFNKELFDNEISEIKSIFPVEAENMDLNKYINNYLEKLIIPILNCNPKDEEIYEKKLLIKIIGEKFLSKKVLEIIFEFDRNKKIIDNNTFKKFLNIIRLILENLINDENYKRIDYTSFFNLVSDKTINYNEKKYFGSIIIANEEQYQNYFLDLYSFLYEVIKLNKELFIIPIDILLKKLKKIDNKELRNIIYKIILILIENKEFSKIKGVCSILQIRLLKMIYNDNSELLGKLLLRMDYSSSEEKEKFDGLIIPFLFKYSLRNNKLDKLLDLLYVVLNLKDQFILDRFYLIMGFPQMIIEKTEDIPDDENEEEEETEEKANDEKNTQPNSEINSINAIAENNNFFDKFWPKFGLPYLRNSDIGEAYKYTSGTKIYETHCILAILFPCSQDSLYDPLEFHKKEQKLSEEERKKYIYKLLCICLLNEGNYYLFKYIYLTQSRFILKYKNLYEEMIDILSQDESNKFDLKEIKENAEKCIKKINYELGIENKKSELPEKMKSANKDNKAIKEFTGFIPQHIPDKIVKALYSNRIMVGNSVLLCVKYYTTYQDIELLRKIENKNNDETGLENINKGNKSNEDYYIKGLKSFSINDIKEEGQELIFLLDKFEEEKGQKKTFEIKNKFLEEKKGIKLALIRFIILNYEKTQLFEASITKDLELEKKKMKKIMDNCFISSFNNIGFMKYGSFGEMFNISRKNFEVEFINENKFSNVVKITQMNEFIFKEENYFLNDN